MKTIEEIGESIGFQTNAKNYRKAFYDKYIRDFKYDHNYDLLIEYVDLINIFNIENDIHWANMSRKKLTEEFIRKYSDNLDMYLVTVYSDLSESFIREYIDVLNIDTICQYQYLSMNFIDGFRDIINWDLVSKYQFLTEYFIEKNCNDVNWKHIFENKKLKLTSEFRNKYQYKIEYADKIITSSDLLLEKIQKTFFEPVNNNILDKNINKTNLYKVIQNCPGYTIDMLYDNHTHINFDDYQNVFSPQYFLRNGEAVFINDKLYRIKDDKVKLVNFTMDHVNQDTELFFTEEQAEQRLLEIQEDLNMKLEQNHASSFMTLESLINKLDDIDNVSYSEIKKVVSAIRTAIKNIKK